MHRTNLARRNLLRDGLLAGAAAFAAPVNNFASGVFGRVLPTSVAERQLQFALKLIF